MQKEEIAMEKAKELVCLAVSYSAPSSSISNLLPG